MIVIRQTELGEPDVLHQAEVDRPEPGATELLVRVRAAAVNPVDWKIRRDGHWLTPPFVLGWDVSGVVEQVGVGVSLFAPGDEVYGFPWFPHQAGGYGEFVTAPSRHFAHKPAGLSHIEAAGIPLAGLTAWQGLVDVANVQAGQRVLVTAAAGGVGHLAVQIAKARGAHVIGTARADKHDFLRELGVDEPIDYTAVDVAASLRDVDVILEAIGGEQTLALIQTLKPGGIVIPLPANTIPDSLGAQAKRHGVRWTPLLVEPDHHGLRELAALVERGALRVHVEQTFPLADAAKAHELGERGRVTGKLVLTV
ncbi:NADP-dependent oxidoreductase [Herbihabitans rhizosphaerae]|nr:NADP-dependent oxidoreductase [Herbihabitans rhizosphaerae]